MSLINNMLKDLEKRKTQLTPVPYVAFTKEKTSLLEWLERGKLYYLIATGATFIFVSVYAIKNFIPSTPKVTTAFVKETPVNPTPVHQPSTNENKWLGRVTITGATLQVKDNITELTFLLDHAAFYRLNSDGMSNQFSLIVEHSTLQAELPLSAYLNTAIQHITTESINGSTRFNITLFPGATIKYVNLTSEDKNPELTLAIEYHVKTSTSTKSPSQTVSFKSPVLKSILAQEYHRSLKAAEEGNYQGAIKNLSAVLKSDPTFKDARVSLVALMIDQGHLLQANKIIDEGLQVAPAYAPFVELKARLLSLDGNVSTAITLLQSASPPLVENPEYHALIAALYSRSNKDQLASQLYQQLVQVDAHNSSWWFGLGVSLDKLNQTQGAIEAYTKAMNEGHLNGESLAYLQNRLQLLKETGNVKS